MTGNRTTRKRSTRPASSSDRDRLRLPRVRRGGLSFRFMSRTAATASPATSSEFAHDSGSSNVEEKTTLDIAVSPARLGSSGICSANLDISRYVVAPMRVVCAFSESCSSHSRYSGTSMPQKPGHPSAPPYPSSEMMKSTMRVDIGLSLLVCVWSRDGSGGRDSSTAVSGCERGGELVASRHVQLSVRARQVRLDRRERDEQLLRDVAVRATGRREPRDTLLARRQRVQPGDRPPARPGAAGAQLVGGALRKGGCPALVGQAHRRLELCPRLAAAARAAQLGTQVAPGTGELESPRRPVERSHRGGQPRAALLRGAAERRDAQGGTQRARAAPRAGEGDLLVGKPARLGPVAER